MKTTLNRHGVANSTFEVMKWMWQAYVVGQNKIQVKLKFLCLFVPNYS